MSRRLAAVATALSALALAACGDEGAASGAHARVLAASSLHDVLPQIDPGARYSFAGSDALATQLREGAQADVYVAANRELPEQLQRDGVVDPPRVFAINRLVLIASKRSSIGAVADLRRRAVKLVIGAEGVPIGDYTRAALGRIGMTAALDRVVSEEDDVRGVATKVALGEADAGFVYATDVAAVADAVRTIELPARAQPRIEYAIAVVAGSPRRPAAEAFVRAVLGTGGRSALRSSGFELP